MVMFENLEPTVLVWLAHSESCFDVNYQDKFRQYINCLLTCTDSDECESSIRKYSSDGTRIVLIIDKRSVDRFLQRIDHIQEIASIYIFNESQEKSDYNLTKKVNIIFNFENIHWLSFC